MKDGISSKKIEKIKNNNLDKISSFLKLLKESNKDISNNEKEEFDKYYDDLKDMIKNTFIKVGDYEVAKFNLERVMDFQAFRDYDKEAIESADSRRRSAHDALISYIKELARFINKNFREDVADQLKNKNIKFKKITPSVDFFGINDFKNRQEIEAWADRIYEDMKKLGLINLEEGKIVKDIID